MDFTKLLSIAEKNKGAVREKNVHKSEFSAPKKEKRDKPRSEVVQKLIEEKNREREQERQRKHEEEEMRKLEEEIKRKEEKKRQKFVIPKANQDKQAKLADVLKDLDSSDDDVDDDVSDTDKQREKPSVHENHRDKGYTKERGSSKDKSSHVHNGHKSHHSHSSHKSHSSSDRHHSDSSGSKHNNDKERKHKTESSGHNKRESGHSSHESHHRTHSKEKEKPKSDGNKIKDEKSDLPRSKNSNRSESHKSEKHSSSSRSHSSSTSSSKHRTDSVKTSSGDHQRVSSHSSSERKSGNKVKEPSKKGAKDLSLDELRAQVRKMKEMEAEIAKEEENQKQDNTSNANMFEPYKNRQGVELDEAEAKKAKILARTQAILERTKAKLATEKETEKQTRHRGKRSTTGERTVSDKQVKSKCIVKDDDDDSDEDEIHTLDMSFNGSLAQPESGYSFKDIRKNINKKLDSYNFPDKPVKEKARRAKSVGNKSVKLNKHKVHHFGKESSDKKDRHDKKKLMNKQAKMKALMRNDYENSFGGAQPKIKKPVIIRRQQQQPPPMNFEDLLKIAEKKCQEKTPEPVFRIPQKKKVEERPLTQEELDRRQREKESRIRKKEQEELERSGKLGEKDRADTRKPTSDSASAQKSKSESSLLKGALTKPVGQNSKTMLSSGGTSRDGKSRYDAENDNIIACGPSSSKPSKPAAAAESTNPWDRIYGQIQKNNPKAEKRKRQIIESDEEEESDYDMEDDFIDDEGCVEDVSAHIRNIFGYDKRKYKYVDEEDDRNMEASFASVMKEEARSAKIGKMEDLEDIRREEEELKQKKLAKMKKKMKYR